jgi:ribosome-binding protein aMBF1 (putative translation factor)
MLARIDEAYERIAGNAAAAAGAGGAEATSPAEPPPDPRAQPGASLRHARLTTGLSLQQIAAETKIGVAILERIEAEDFAALPAPVFVRGHVLQFARELRIAEAEGLAKAYIAKMQARNDVER